MGKGFKTGPGGKGCKQAVALARLGADVRFLARVGADLFGQEALALFEREGLDTKAVQQDGKPTGCAFIFVDEQGQNAIGVAPGANGQWTPEALDALQHHFEDTDILLTQLETPLPTVKHSIKLAKAAGSYVVLNPAPAQPLEAAWLAMIDLLTPNESEAETLTGVAVTDTDTAVAAAKKLMDQGVNTVLITMGAKGSVLVSSKGTKKFAAYPVTAVDTTAAGDAFNGALVYGLSLNQTIEASVDFASKAAALAVTRKGAVPSLPTKAEVEDFL